MSFNDFMNSLKGLFPVDWSIRNGKLIIEHQLYFENGGSYTSNINSLIDVTGLINNTTGKQQIIRTNKYTYDQSNIFNIETFQSNAFINEEFKTLSIVYGVFSKERKENIFTTQFITDVGAVISDHGQFSDDSICIIGANYLQINTNNFQWQCVTEQDYLSGFEVCNGHLTPANLIMNYWKYYRQFLTGVLDHVGVTFDSETKKKLQTILISECNYVSLYSENLIKTNLGVGRIITARQNLLNKSTELTLLLSYAEN